MSASRPVPRPPGPPPLNGSLARLRHARRFIADPIALVGGRFETYGDLYYVPNDQGGVYVTRHPDHFRDVLVTHGDSFMKGHSAFARLARVLGQGLLTTDGEVWKRHRRMIQGAFHKPRLTSYAPMMVAEAARTADSWRDGESVELTRDFAELTLRVVSRSLFSHEVADDVAAITGAVAVLQESFSQIDILPQWVPTAMRRRTRNALQAIDTMMYRLIAKRRAAGFDIKNTEPDLLHMLLAARDEEGDGAGLNDTEIRDQLVTFYLAGHETTSQALTWTMYLLSQHPEVEARLHAEVDQVLCDRLPGFDDVDSLVYTEKVVRESMRLFPPVYSLARKAGIDTQIGDYQVPAGSEVALWIYFSHHDPRWFSDPEHFDPDRFDNASYPRHAYVPFGSGARTCVGKTFATMEAVLLLATLVRRWRLRLESDQRIAMKTRVTLIPKFGMRMRAELRRK